jgi:hypothetical protein
MSHKTSYDIRICVKGQGEKNGMAFDIFQPHIDMIGDDIRITTLVYQETSGCTCIPSLCYSAYLP